MYRGYYGADPAAETVVRSAGMLGQLGLGLKKEKRAEAQEERAQKKFEQDQQDREDYNKYYPNLQKNINWRPPPEDKSAFNAKMFSSAQLDALSIKMKDTDFQKAVLEKNRLAIDERHRVISQHINGAFTALADNNLDAALKEFEKAYEEHKDGADLIIGADGKSYTVKMRNGTENTVRFNNKQEMVEHFRIQAKAMLPKEAYAKTWMAEWEERTNENVRLAQQDEYYVNAKGIRGLAGRRIDPATGKERKVYEVWDPEVHEVTEAEWKGLKMMSQAQRKGEAVIKYYEEGAGLRKTKQDPKPEAVYEINGKPLTKEQHTVLEKETKAFGKHVMMPDEISMSQYDRLNDMSKSPQFKKALKAAQDNPAAMEGLKKLFESEGIPDELTLDLDLLINWFITHKPHRADKKH